MNRHGMVLNDMGLERAMDILLDRCVRPIAAQLFADCGGGSLDQHHTFVVQYHGGGARASGASGLDMHTDDSEVTLNASLLGGAAHCTGGGLQFCGMAASPTLRQHSGEFAHRPGIAILHAGRHRHGANDLTAGERLNLIMWCRSREYRDVAAELSLEGAGGSAAVKEEDEPDPDPRCLSHTHDLDYSNWAEVFGKKRP